MDGDSISFREYLDQAIDRLRVEMRMLQELVERDLGFAREAREYALTDLDRRLEAMNNRSAELSLEIRNIFARIERHGELDDMKHDKFAKQLDALEQFKDNMQGRLWMLGALSIFAGSLVELVMHYFWAHP